MQVLVRPRQRQRPAAHSIAPQHSLLALHGAPAPVQQRNVPRSVAQWSPAQHARSLVHAVRLPGARHAVVGDRQVPAAQVSPGQQSAPSQAIPAVWHTHQRPDAVPDAAQDIRPQQVFCPAPASATPASPPVAPPHAVPAGVQQRLAPPAVDEHESPAQHSALDAQPVAPKGRQVGVMVVMRAQRPAAQVVPAQHSASSRQLDPSGWHAQRRVVASQSRCPQQSREVPQAPPTRWQQRAVTGAGLHS